jgi:hypothetical protein
METTSMVIPRRHMDYEGICVFQNGGRWMTLDSKDIHLLLDNPTI